MGSGVGGPGYGVPEEVVDVGVGSPGAGYCPTSVAVSPSVGVSWAGSVCVSMLDVGITANSVLSLVAVTDGCAVGEGAVTADVAEGIDVPVGSGVLARRQELKDSANSTMSASSASRRY